MLAQDFPDFEFIIVDNGSTARSGQSADEYAAKDTRVHVIHKEKENIGSVQNAGLDAAKGEYIAFVDDDDILYSDMLSFLYDLTQKYNADVAVCGSDKEVEGQIVPNCTFHEILVMNAGEAVAELLKRKKYNAATPTKLWKATIFDKICFLNVGKYDDITVVYKLWHDTVYGFLSADYQNLNDEINCWM